MPSRKSLNESFVATFSEFLLRLNPILRNDAVVVYDNPSEGL